MKVVKLNIDNVKDFVAYCKRYATQQDESYIPRDDYTPREDELIYLLFSSDNQLTGVAALMLYREYREIKKGRFRILHCIDKNYDNYKNLLSEIEKNCAGIENIYCFITEEKADIREIWEKLGFKIKRYSWVLDKKIEDKISFQLRDGFLLKKIEHSRDEQAWCNIINSAFADIEGHTHMLPERIDEMRKEKEYLEDGMNILWNSGKPAGLIKLIKLNENGEDLMFIETLAVHPDYQGRGLGRMLLKYGVNFGKDMGLKRAMLSVNAENESATDLYFKEGFKKAVVYICYNKQLS